jgi:hypothetical protein
LAVAVVGVAAAPLAADIDGAPSGEAADGVEPPQPIKMPPTAAARIELIMLTVFPSLVAH